MRQQQRVAARRRSVIVLGTCLVAVLLVVGAGTSLLGSDDPDDAQVGELGVAAADAGCQEDVTRSAQGEGSHVPAGIDVPYPEAPPAFGPHYDAPQPMSRKFYTDADRPPVETLVHNLEHGYTVVWYDESVAGDDDRLEAVRAITERYPATSGLDDKLLAVPWTSDDGPAFPAGMHVALTHWSNGGVGADDPVGVWRYCADVSGEVVDQFVADYPFTDAPEGDVPG